jgi:2-keto-myo-inositol isomerase
MLSCINGATTMPYSFEEDMNAAGKAGFQAVEVWYSKLQTYLKDHTLSHAREVIEKNKLLVAALCPTAFSFFKATDEVRQKFEDTAAAAKALGCTLLLVCPDVPPAELGHAEAVRRAAEESRRYCEIASRYGVRIALEALGGHRFVPGPTQAMEIITLVDRPDMLLMMDTFHYYKSGVTMEEIRAIPAGKMTLIHVNSCEDLPREKLTDKNRLWPTLGVVPAPR